MTSRPYVRIPARIPALISTLAATLFLGALAGCATPAPSKPAVTVSTEVKSLLWLGNSFYYFNNSMHDHVNQLLRGAGVTGTRANSVAISAAGLDWHDLASHFRPGGMARYSFRPDNTVQFNTFDKPYDAVMMMDCSQCPVHPQLKPVFHEWVAKHSVTARKHGAAPILFMSWAYQDKPEMTQELAAEYLAAGKANNALVVPVGLAFANASARRPDLNLYIADKRHPSMMGTYLASAVVLASVYKKNPVGLAYSAGLPADVAAFLQGVAWETTQAFHAKEGRGSL